MSKHSVDIPIRERISPEVAERLFWISKGERDKMLIKSPTGPLVASRKLTTWLNHAGGYSSGESDSDSEGVYEHPYPSYDNRWGEWKEQNRQRLEESRNFAYKIYETAAQIAFSELTGSIDGGVNKTFAQVLAQLMGPYHRILNFLHQYHNPKDISRRTATKLTGMFLENALSLNVKDLVERNSLVSLLKLLEKKMSGVVEEYPDFNLSETQVSLSLLTARERLSSEQEEEVGLQRSEEGGWVFYATANQWSTDKVSRARASHTPAFPIDYMFKGHEQQIGVLLYGSPIMYFSHDVQTTHDELMLGKKWTIERSIDLTQESIHETSNQLGIAEEQLTDQIREMLRDYQCFSLQEAWDKRGRENDLRLYTEIWLDAAIPYAIFINKDFDQKNPYTNMNTLAMLQARPDLPIVDSTGKFISRSDLYTVALKRLTEYEMKEEIIQQ